MGATLDLLEQIGSCMEILIEIIASTWSKCLTVGTWLCTTKRAQERVHRQ